MSTAPRPQTTNQDPVKVDSKHYKVEFENDRVRVLRVHYGPHEKSVMHSHPDCVVVFQNDVHCSFTFPDGKTEEHRIRAGETMFTTAGSHLPENLGDQGIDVVLVELKK
jgi:quercetin dioxygenase-like cupin family protein